MFRYGALCLSPRKTDRFARQCLLENKIPKTENDQDALPEAAGPGAGVDAGFES